MLEFSQSTRPLIEQFPQGGFALHGNSKIFGAMGIALAIYATAAKENKAKVAGLLIPATLTAILVGITEPLEFTFLFISPLLFAIHALLAATMSTVMYLFGVVGNMGGGLLDQFLPQNWIPMFHNHAGMMFTQIAIGLVFTGIWFLIFRALIIRLNLKTPGREDSEIKLYSKSDYQAAKNQRGSDSATQIIEALGGVKNIRSLNNCATRLRISLVNSKLAAADEEFIKLGAHGVVRHGDSIQVIIGLHVPQVRENMESIMNNSHQQSSLVMES